MKRLPWQFRVDEIELVCGYIKDDPTVASYFGISVDKVSSIRSRMREVVTPAIEHEASGGYDTQRLAEEDARNGSRLLNERIQSLFYRWELMHGFQEGAASVLLPAGYSERSREAA